MPVEVSAKILPDGRWQAFVRDISERRHAEEALRRSEESLNRAQRVAHVGSWDWDLVTDEITRSAERHPERGLVPLRVSAAPIDHAPPGVIEAIVAFEDISALKELERLCAEWNSLIAHVSGSR